MTLSYSVGLTSGSAIAYAFDAMLGPHADVCRRESGDDNNNIANTTNLTTSVSTATYMYTSDKLTSSVSTRQRQTTKTMPELTSAATYSISAEQTSEVSVEFANVTSASSQEQTTSRTMQQKPTTTQADTTTE